MDSCIDQQPISDDIEHKWTKLEVQAKNDMPPHDHVPLKYVSLDHFMLVDEDHVYAFHLKEHYWSRFDIKSIGTNEKIGWYSCFVKPGLVVSVQHCYKNGREFPILLRLTWETEQGNPKNFCLQSQEISFRLPETLYEISFHTDDDSLYIVGLDENQNIPTIGQINLETYQTSERRIEGRRLKERRVFCQGKLFVLDQDQDGQGPYGFWALDLKTLEWEDPKEFLPKKLEYCVSEGRLNLMIFENKIFVFSMKEHCSAILSYDLNKGSWTESFLVTDNPENRTFFWTKPIYRSQDSFILFTNLDVYSFRNPIEYERSTKEHIKKHIETFCDKPDVIFKVEDQEFPAHRSVLSYRSSYFKNAFSSNMMESSQKIIPIDNVSAKVFKVLLQYIYCEDFKIEDDMAVDLFRLSHEYNLKKLNKDCEKVLIRNLAVENVIYGVLFAEKYEAPKLRNACLFFITNNLKEVFSLKNLKDLENETLLDIVELAKGNRHFLGVKDDLEFYI